MHYRSPYEELLCINISFYKDPLCTRYRLWLGIREVQEEVTADRMGSRV